MGMGKERAFSVNDIIYDKDVSATYKRFVNLFLYPRGIRDFIFHRVPIQIGERVLDAGCGDGAVSRAIATNIARHNISGVEHHAFDISPHMLEEFRRSCSFPVALQRLDVRQLPYPEGYFDVIVTSAMLEYVEKIEEGLASLRRVLKTDGRLYIFMSRKTALNDLLFRPFGNPKCYSPQKLRAILETVGFSTVEQHAFSHRFFWLNMWGYVLKSLK